MSTTYQEDHIYNKYYPKILSQCINIMKNIDDAQDLAQDTFLKVYQKLGTFRGESKISTWIYTICRNEALMRFRNKIYRNEVTEYDNKIDIFLQTQVDNQLNQLQELQYREIMNILPRGYRTILQLSINGYDHEEIATICGINVGNSKSQLHKARNRFLALWNKQNHQSKSKSKMRNKTNG